MAKKPKPRVGYRPSAAPRVPKKSSWSHDRRQAHLVKVNEQVRKGTSVDDDSLAFVLDELDSTMRRASREISGAFLGGVGVGALVAGLVGWRLSQR